MKESKILVLCKPVILTIKEIKLQLQIIDESSELKFPDVIDGYPEFATFLGSYLNDCMES